VTQKYSACLTLDIEPDWVTLPTSSRYYGVFDTPGHFERFCALIKEYQIPLTCYVVGSALKDRPDHIRELQKLGAEFGCHSLTHNMEPQYNETEVRGGIQAFSEFFGHLPQGYRSPQGRLNRAILTMLHQENVVYDSSVIPSYRPLAYSNLGKPMTPFLWQDLNLVELPMGALHGVRIPTAFSYVKLLGEKIYWLLYRLFRAPESLVLLSHMADLTYSPQAMAHHKLIWKLVYRRNRQNSWDIFRRLIEHWRAHDYRFVYMSELYESARNDSLPTINLPAL
jgi:peptidoglycan/xylan/chitin deacetylase (PgdA/CDA1 family)